MQSEEKLKYVSPALEEITLSSVVVKAESLPDPGGKEEPFIIIS